MGAIVDRSQEHLGNSDLAVVQVRRLLLQLADDCTKGIAPEAPKHGDWYNVRSASITLDPSVPFEQGAAMLLAGAELSAAK
jgi:hypothetical protein